MAGIGGAVFVVSDALIAVDAFDVLPLPAQGFWVVSTYVLAQPLLVLAARHDPGARRMQKAPPG